MRLASLSVLLVIAVLVILGITDGLQVGSTIPSCPLRIGSRVEQLNRTRAAALLGLAPGRVVFGLRPRGPGVAEGNGRHRRRTPAIQSVNIASATSADHRAATEHQVAHQLH
jgi:hypothetical protein